MFFVLRKVKAGYDLSKGDGGPRINHVLHIRKDWKAVGYPYEYGPYL